MAGSRKVPGRGLQVAETEIILIAAPDASFRRSLEFALESDGFRVFAFANVNDALACGCAQEVVCAVLDDDAIDDWEHAGELFGRFAKPIILLIGLFRAAPDLPFVELVMKPFLGEPLIQAVRKAVAGLA